MERTRLDMMLPEAFVARMKEMLGGEFDAFLKSFEQERYQALRLNTLKRREDGCTAAEYLESGEKCPDWGTHLSKVPWAENGYYYESADKPGRHPFHEAGLYYIQEPSAMAPVGLLDVRPGQTVLDLCAAPGGKSTQIAAILEAGGEEGLLVSNEIHPARAKILSENVERMGICQALVTNESPRHLSEVFVEYFDRILVDAPCSGEGMFRKNEAACQEWSPENVALCGERQDEILDCAADMLAPGGRMVYSTCTFAPVENEGSISRFLERHPEFVLIPIDKKVYRFVSDGADQSNKHALDGVASYVERVAEGIEGTLRLWPHFIKGEGHYAAVLEKRGNAVEQDAGEVAVSVRCGRLAVGGLEIGSSFEKLQKQKDMANFVTFCKNTLRLERLLEKKGAGVQLGEDRKILRFGDNLYLVPERMPALKGLKVLRPGLHLGTLKKNRFEPSHALALALQPGEVQRSFELWGGERKVEATLEEACAPYLNGMTLSAEGEKGWYLICADGFSIGWGKLAGNVMKNHYPKGLRK